MKTTITRRQLGGLALGAGLAATTRAAAQTPRRGGNIVFAAEAQPPTMDMHFSTTIATRNIAMHMYEQLATRGENNEPIPELAESWSESADGLTWTFRLRQGIKFHNGKTLTSADVLASWERYKRIGLSRSILGPVASMAAPDPNTFVVTLTQRVPVFIDEISSFAVPITIHPAEEMGKEGNRIEPIGTGPYQFVEWVPDSHVRLRRYDGYTADTRFPGTNGFGGRKTAHLDTVEFRYVREPGARVAGMETGQFHVTEDIPPRAAERLRPNTAIQIHPLRHFWQQCSWVNHVRPPTNNLLVRRAIQTALDMEEIMTVAADGVFDLNPAFQYPGNPYYVLDGREFYNPHNPARARELLREARYNNEQLVLLTNSSFTSMYNAAVSVTEQLRAIGMNVRMDVFDWPTAIANQRNREAWNLWFTGQGTGPAVGPLAAFVNLVSPQNQAFEPDAVLDGFYNEMRTLPTEEQRKAAFGRFQRRAYEHVHVVKYGDLTKVQAARSTVKGFAPYRIPRFWNVWIEG